MFFTSRSDRWPLPWICTEDVPKDADPETELLDSVVELRKGDTRSVIVKVADEDQPDADKVSILAKIPGCLWPSTQEHCKAISVWRRCT